MGNFRDDGRNRFNNRGGGFRDRGGRRDGHRSGRPDRGPATMYQAVCDECGESCEVPFKPTNDKPVYCNTCFNAHKGRSSDSGGYANKNNDKPRPQVRTDRDFDSRKANGEIKSELHLLNEKIDSLVKLVEKVVVNQEIAGVKGKTIVKELPAAKKNKATKTKKPVKQAAAKKSKAAKKK